MGPNSKNGQIASELLKQSYNNISSTVTLEWVNDKMFEHNLKQSDICMDTGLNPTNLSAYITGKRPMGQPVKAFFYYFFKSLSPSKWDSDKMLEQQAEAISYAVSCREQEMEEAYEPIKQALQELLHLKLMKDSDPDNPKYIELKPFAWKQAIVVLERFKNLTES